VIHTYPKTKVAAAHVAPVYLDTERTVEKTCSLIAEAARAGAQLIAFPETFISAFPIWTAIAAPILTHDLFKALAASAIEVDGPEMLRIRETARRHHMIVSIGFNEGTKASVGCIWNSNALIGEDGTLLNHHRKLVPTHYEKLAWTNGDGAGLRVVETPIGRIGMLICGENTNPLARYTLMAQGEQIHISSYPPAWPTRPASQSGGYDLEQAIKIRAGAHSFEAKVFNVVASACVDKVMLDRLASALGSAVPGRGCRSRAGGSQRVSCSILAADEDTIRQPQNDQRDDRGISPNLVARQHRNQQSRNTEAHNRNQGRSPTPEPIPKVTEHYRANWPTYERNSKYHIEDGSLRRVTETRWNEVRERGGQHCDGEIHLEHIDEKTKIGCSHRPPSNKF
jgi:predicted amidohydrolase